MINANELRIGNYYIDICGKINKWELNSFRFYEYNPLTGDNLYNAIRPVEITPGVLERAGFEQKERIGNWDTYIAYINGDISFNNNSGCYFKNKRLERRIEYLHDLQNLFHALTGEELNIEL